MTVDGEDVLRLLDLDAYSETFVPRSRVFDYLARQARLSAPDASASDSGGMSATLRLGHVLDLARAMPSASVQCVVTSPPYWAMRVYDDSLSVEWADGEQCPYGHEQTPEGYARHSTEVLAALSRLLSDDGSIWWNVGDTYNTRTQVRRSAAETLHAMQGQDARSWGDHSVRRYSSGHAYLKDGELCLIPAMVAERASRVGLYVKAFITWAKSGRLPEPHHARVSRGSEYVLHLSKRRSPSFSRDAYRAAAREMGGPDPADGLQQLSDVWTLGTSAGGGHGAQFPPSLPGRCIALSAAPGDLVLDPFVGSGNSGVAALRHGCRFFGWDCSAAYLEKARERLESVVPCLPLGP